MMVHSILLACLFLLSATFSSSQITSSQKIETNGKVSDDGQHFQLTFPTTKGKGYTFEASEDLTN